MSRGKERKRWAFVIDRELGVASSGMSFVSHFSPYLLCIGSDCGWKDKGEDILDAQILNKTSPSGILAISVWRITLPIKR